MKILIPFISAFLFRFGGCDQVEWLRPFNQKLWRWLMGVIIGLFYWKGWLIYLLTIGTYFIATNLFSYGEKSPILKYLPKVYRFIVSGFIFGLASIFLIGWLAILQAIISAMAYLIIMYLDDKDIIKNPWVELLRGFFGTLLLIK